MQALLMTFFCFFLVQQGLNMVSKVIRRGENVLLTCNERVFNSSFDHLKTSPVVSPGTHRAPKFTWFIKPSFRWRTLLASCLDVKPEYKDTFELVQDVESENENMGCFIRSKNAFLIPAGTYECVAIGTNQNQKRFLSELVIMEDEPVCRLVTKEGDKEVLIYSNSENRNHSSDLRAIVDGTRVEIHCSANYSGHLVHSFCISTIAMTPTTKLLDENRTISLSFTDYAELNVTFLGSEMIKVGLSASFHSQTNDSIDGKALNNVPVYQIHFPLILVPSKDIRPTSAEVITNAVVTGNDGSDKEIMGGSALPILGLLVAMLVFIVFSFTFCYFRMNKRIRDIQTGNPSASGESVPHHFREANSLYDEINPDEETSEFNLKFESYAKLDPSTLLRKALDNGIDSSHRQGKRSTYVQPDETTSNFYLDLTDSNKQQNLTSKNQERSSAKCESLTPERSKVNNSLHLGIPENGEVSLTYLHIPSDDKASNTSSTYENNYS